MPKTNQETRTVDESVLADQPSVIPDQDPIAYRYNNNASDGERLIGVPLSDLRQSVWDELPKWSKQAVTKSHLYTKVEAK